MDLLAAAAYFFLDSSESETDEEIVLDDAEIADNTPKVEPLEEEEVSKSSACRNTYCNTCFDMAIGLLQHQMKTHDSYDSERLQKLLTLFQQMQSESTDSNFNYEITVDYNCWLKTIDQVSAPTGDIPVVHIPSPTEPIIPSKSDIKHEPDESPTTDNCITADSHQPDAGGTENQLTSTEPSTAFSCYNHNFKDKYSYIAQENRYYCDLCLDSFKTVRDIETHLHTRCQSTKAIRYVCTECNVEFKNANLHRHHMQVLHPDSAVAQTIRDNSRLICDYCGRIFKLRNELRRHMYKHNGLPRPFVCRVCDRGFVHASSYAGHLRMHSGDKPYKCSAPNCQQSFTTNSGLYIHHLTVHADKEQYKHQCEFCQKRFSVKNRLTDHRRMHTGERPYQCNYCANTYKTKKDRRRHHRTHNGERPHKCDACNKTFIRKDNMKVHTLRCMVAEKNRNETAVSSDL